MNPCQLGSSTPNEAPNEVPSIEENDSHQAISFPRHALPLLECAGRRAIELFLVDEDALKRLLTRLVYPAYFTRRLRAVSK